MKVGVVGCGQGELDRVFDSVRQLQQRLCMKLDLLICCGDLQVSRNEADLEEVPRDPKWKSMKDFRKFYGGEKEAPVTTLFIGSRQEPPNFLRELYFGGWVAPKIFYLGHAGVVRVGPLRIAGLSGGFKPQDYFRGHHETPPFNEQTRLTYWNVRQWDVARLERLTGAVDIVVSHEWPRGIWHHGDVNEMLGKDERGDLKIEMDNNSLGSPAAMEVLKKVKPTFWFSAKPMMKFPAIVTHGDGTFTRFLALDRVQPGRDFMQVLDVEPRSPSCLRALPAFDDKPRLSLRLGTAKDKDADAAARIDYDPEWLAIQKVNHATMKFNWENEKATVVAPTREDLTWVVEKLKAKLQSVPRPHKRGRHQSLLPIKMREYGRDAETFKTLSTAQLRELFETRGLEFPGHLDKASLLRQLKEHDEFFAEGNSAEGLADAFPIPENFTATPENPAEQRRALLEMLELEDLWAIAAPPHEEKTAAELHGDQSLNDLLDATDGGDASALVPPPAPRDADAETGEASAPQHFEDDGAQDDEAILYRPMVPPLPPPPPPPAVQVAPPPAEELDALEEPVAATPAEELDAVEEQLYAVEAQLDAVEENDIIARHIEAEELREALAQAEAVEPEDVAIADAYAVLLEAALEAEEEAAEEAAQEEEPEVLVADAIVQDEQFTEVKVKEHSAPFASAVKEHSAPFASAAFSSAPYDPFEEGPASAAMGEPAETEVDPDDLGSLVDLAEDDPYATVDPYELAALPDDDPAEPEEDEPPAKVLRAA